MTYFPIYRSHRDKILSECGTSALTVLAVWLALSDICNTSGHVFPAKLSVIARLAGVSKRSVIRALKHLESIGLITREAGTNAFGGNSEFVFTISDLENAPQLTPPGAAQSSAPCHGGTSPMPASSIIAGTATYIGKSRRRGETAPSDRPVQGPLPPYERISLEQELRDLKENIPAETEFLRYERTKEAQEAKRQQIRAMKARQEEIQKLLGGAR